MRRFTNYSGTNQRVQNRIFLPVLGVSCSILLSAAISRERSDEALWSTLRSPMSAQRRGFHVFPPRPASEYSSPGRPLSCFVDENTPITGTNGATCGQTSDPRLAERRVRSQRHRNYMSRTHLHTPPDLPEGYGT